MTPRRSTTPVAPRSPGTGTVEGQKPTGGSSLDDLLELGSTLEATRADIKATPNRVRQTVSRSVERAKEALDKTGQTDPAAVRAKILNADFDSVKELANQEEADFAAALEALKQVCDGMDLEFQQLLEPTQAELAVVENAKAVVARVEEEISQMKVTRNPLKSWFGTRERNLTALEERLKVARENVTTAETKLQQMMRQRLMSAKMDASVDAYMQVSTKTVEIMKGRVKDVGEHIVMLTERQQDALAQKSEAASKLKQFSTQLQD